MIKIQITENSNPTPRNVGKSQLLEQTAWAHLPKTDFPKEIRVSQWTGSKGEIPQAYPIGEYTFDADSLSVGKYGELVCRPKLVPLKKG